MFSINRKAIIGAVATLAFATQVSAPAFAQYRGYAVQQPTTKQKVKGYFYRHPKVKSATIGAGVGTAAGAVTGLVSGRGIMRGAMIGAGTGAGVGLIRSSEILKRHPIVRATATGSAAGLGLGMAASRGNHGGLKGAAVGGAVGLGLGALTNVLR